MILIRVTFLCALLVPQCFTREPINLDVDYRWPFGRYLFDVENQPAISLSTLYRELRNQSSEWVAWQLVRMFTAAADGDEFYHLEVDLSDRNRRTAQVVMKMLLQFPTQEEMSALLNAATAYTVEKLNRNSRLEHPLEVLLDRLDEQLRENANLSATYSRLLDESRNSSLTSNRKRYFNRVINADAGYLPMEPNFMAVPGNLKLMLQNGFREKLRYDEHGGRTAFNEYVLANAIYRLGTSEEYREKVELIREKVTTEILGLMAKEKLVPFFFDPNWFVQKMLRKLERALNEQPDLRRELTKAKQAIEWEKKTAKLIKQSASLLPLYGGQGVDHLTTRHQYWKT